MPTSRKPQFTIANGLLIVGVIAVILGVLTTPSLSDLFRPIGLISILGILAILILFWVVIGTRIIELIFGLHCPNCGQKGLERRAVLSFGERFFLCPACGVRCRRTLFGSIGLLWSDASSPEYDYLYQKPLTEDPWNAPPSLEDEDDVAYSKTHLNLVQSKRRRSPENPNGPGLE